MKDCRSPRRTGSRAACAAALAGCLALAPALLVARPAWAADCPNPAPQSARERQTLAREWFSRAEAAETASDDVAAVKAYSCSFDMVPHESTAYKLARAAERAGDLRLALTAHRDYLTLKPGAADRGEVEARIISLQGRLAVGGGGPIPPLPSAPVAVPPVRKPAAALTTNEVPARPWSSSLAARMGTTEWVIAGVGAAALVSGIVFNIGARSEMSDCRSMARANNIVGARDACDRASPFAYTSYALLGTAAAAVIGDAVLIFTKPAPAPAVGFVPLAGGGAVTASGRF
jgi:hypothetical protein